MLNTFYLIVSLVLGILNIIQFFQRQNETQRFDNLLTNWHNLTEGLRNALMNITQNQDLFSNKSDIIASVGSIYQITSSMASAMEEQRFYPGQQAKIKRENAQKKFENNMKKFTHKQPSQRN
jgi:hypothetical protein